MGYVSPYDGIKSEEKLLTIRYSDSSWPASSSVATPSWSAFDGTSRTICSCYSHCSPCHCVIWDLYIAGRRKVDVLPYSKLGRKLQRGNRNKLQNARQLCLGYSPLTSAIIVSPNMMYKRDFVSWIAHRRSTCLFWPNGSTNQHR